MTTANVTRRWAELLRQGRDARSSAESDAQLLARYRDRRDTAAFEALVRRHGPLVLAACRKVLSASTDVEDVFQATFLVLLRDPGAVCRRDSVGSWLCGVAHRVAVRARDTTGRAVDSAGQPAKDAYAMAHTDEACYTDLSQGASPLCRIRSSLQIGPDGRFRLQGLAPGLKYKFQFVLRKNFRDVAITPLEVVVKPGEVKDLGDIRLVAPKPPAEMSR